MLQTDQQRRWWFANHPEYSHGSSGGGRGRRSGRSKADSDKVTPEDVDAYVDDAIKYVPENIRTLLEIFKKTCGTEGASAEGKFAGSTAAADPDPDTVSDATGVGGNSPRRLSEMEEIALGRPSYQGTLDYQKGLEDGMRWALDRNRGTGPPLVLNPEYLDGFSDGVTHIWKGAKTATDLWDNLSGEASDAWDTIRNFPFGYGLSNESRDLRREMEKAGKEIPPGHDAHHVVPSRDNRFPEAMEARGILEKFGIRLKDPANGVALPRIRGISEAAYHPEVHTRENYRRVLDALGKAKTREQALETFESIGGKLSKGLPLD